MGVNVGPGQLPAQQHTCPNRSPHQTGPGRLAPESSPAELGLLPPLQPSRALAELIHQGGGVQQVRDRAADRKACRHEQQACKRTHGVELAHGLRR